MTQMSQLDLKVGDLHCANVGQADYVALLRDSIHRLQCILQLAMDYAIEYYVEIVPDKISFSVSHPMAKPLIHPTGRYEWCQD